MGMRHTLSTADRLYRTPLHGLAMLLWIFRSCRTLALAPPISIWDRIKSCTGSPAKPTHHPLSLWRSGMALPQTSFPQVRRRSRRQDVKYFDNPWSNLSSTAACRPASVPGRACGSLCEGLAQRLRLRHNQRHPSRQPSQGLAGHGVRLRSPQSAEADQS